MFNIFRGYILCPTAAGCSEFGAACRHIKGGWQNKSLLRYICRALEFCTMVKKSPCVLFKLIWPGAAYDGRRDSVKKTYAPTNNRKIYHRTQKSNQTGGNISRVSYPVCGYVFRALGMFHSAWRYRIWGNCEKAHNTCGKTEIAELFRVGFGESN